MNFKDYYDDFFNAIENAVEKRYPENSMPTLGLSSGTDSGTIAAALHHLDKNFNIVTLEGIEEKEILNKRLKLLDRPNFIISKFDKKLLLKTQKEMAKIGYREGVGTGIGIGTSHYVLAKNSSPILYSGLGTDEFYTGNHKLFSTFLYFSHISYFYFNISTKFPLLDSKVIKEFYSLEPEMRLHYKQPFRKYMEYRDFPYTTKKINFTTGV